MPLTVKECDHAKPSAGPRKLFDGGGLYLLIRPNGTKLWQLAYRFGGKPRTASFGGYHPDPKKGVTLAEARDKRDTARKQIKDGTDPVEARRAKETVTSGTKPFKEVADEWIALINKKPRSEKTQDRDTRMVNKLVAAFGNKAIADVEPRDVITVLDAYESNGTHETRRRAQATALRIMAYARGKQYVPINPLVGVGFNDSYTTPEQTPRPALVETEPFTGVLRHVWGYNGRQGNLVGIALKLLTLTMVRPGTVCNAEWSEFDLDGEVPMWTIPFTKLKQRKFREKIKELRGKPHFVPLSRQAVALLRDLQGLTGNSRFLFPGVRRKKAGKNGIPAPGPLSTNALEIALNSMAYQDMHCPHGFRSSASTLLNAERVTVEGHQVPRFSEDAVEYCLEHVDASQAATYNRNQLLPERTHMLQHWADMCDQMRTSNQPPKLRMVA
ncbi:integrase [Bradyrhizobium sp. AZCC 2262]|uniref:tyrosine-type recombinase/integrase n=1 Tax=Bradyrhizobium sp. AZCC 2262 TaxID=3117022 RepID=UPI002FEF2730